MKVPIGTLEVTPLEILQGMVSNNKNVERVPVVSVSLGSSYWRELNPFGFETEGKFRILFPTGW